jgi:alpha-beta hydrolase superfamily lysophospholipase
MNKKIFFLIFAFLFLLSFSQIRAQDIVDYAHYIIYYGGRQVGEEEYTTRQRNDTLILSDKTNFIISNQTFDLNTYYVLTKSFQPIKLNIAGKFMEQKINWESIFSQNKSFNRSWPDSGIINSETQLHQPLAVLPNGVFSLYCFLLQQYDYEKGGKQDFNAFVPFETELAVSVEDKGIEKVDFLESTAMLKRMFVNFSGLVGVNIWVNSQIKIVKISIPTQGIEVSRINFTPPQKPQSKIPVENFTSEEVVFKSGKNKLSGTVTIPPGKGPFPSVIIVSGSGPQDRNGKTAGVGFTIGYDIIGNKLSNNGFLVLRYDERGIGKSTGNFASASFYDFVSDVKAAIKYLRSRKDVDSKRISLIGHSEGGAIVPLIASKDKKIKALVLMAAPAQSLDKIILEQQQYSLDRVGLDQEKRKEAEAEEQKFLELMKDDAAWEKGEIPEPYKRFKETRKWYKEFIALNPIENIKKVKCNILILQGGKDKQVAPEQAEKLNEALNQAENQNHLLKIFPDLDHLFIFSQQGDYAEYGDAQREIDPQFLDFLTEWLQTNL